MQPFIQPAGAGRLLCPHTPVGGGYKSNGRHRQETREDKTTVTLRYALYLQSPHSSENTDWGRPSSSWGWEGTAGEDSPKKGQQS